MYGSEIYDSAGLSFLAQQNPVQNGTFHFVLGAMTSSQFSLHSELGVWPLCLERFLAIYRWLQWVVHVTSAHLLTRSLLCT